MASSFNVSLHGFKQTIQALKDSVHDIEEQVDDAVERRALTMVNETRQLAPRLTGKLKNSIDIIPQGTSLMHREYGTNVEYAQRQEYEHKTKKAFFRKTVDKNKPLLRADIQAVIDRNSGGL